MTVPRTHQQRRVRQPPPFSNTADFAVWLRQLADAVNALPPIALSQITGNSMVLSSLTTQAQIKGDPLYMMSGADPKLLLYNSGASADAQVWDVIGGTNAPKSTNFFAIRSRDNADATGTNIFLSYRSGSQCTHTEMNEPVLLPHGVYLGNSSNVSATASGYGQLYVSAGSLYLVSSNGSFLVK